MENAQTISQWQEFLQSLAPVEGWLYIGAGRGDVLRETRFAKVPKLLAVEAEAHASQLLAHAIAAHNNENSHWKALNALVSNRNGPATWHYLSRDEESGLLPADTLSALWPNLDEHQRTEHPAVSLSHLLAQTDEDQAQYNWLTIDCLPAARLLQGLGGALQSLDMIEVRVAIGGIAHPDTGTTLEECDELLLPQGFARLALEEADNPLLGRALYGRDFKLQLAEMQNAYTALENLNDTLQKEREGLRNELQDQRKRETQLQEKIQEAQQSAIEYESLNYTLRSQCDDLKAINDVIQKERERMRHDIESHRDNENRLKEKLQQTQTELREQQSSAQLSTKLLAKVEADTSELRERYAEKVKSEQELKDLIKELHAKLQAASHFYHKLEQEHPELLEKL